jgi:hypothetical protein
VVAWAEGRERYQAVRVRRSAGIWIAALAVFAALLVGGAWIGREPLKRAARIALAAVGIRTPSSTVAAQAPPGGVAARAVAAQTEAETPSSDAGEPASGTWILTPSGPRGAGSLRIDNRSGRDALAKLVTGSGERSWCIVYVRSGTAVTIPRIPPGSYRLRFSIGFDWNAQAGGFGGDPSYLELQAPLAFGVPDQAGYRFKDAQYVTLRGPGESGAREITADTFSGS